MDLGQSKTSIEKLCRAGDDKMNRAAGQPENSEARRVLVQDAIADYSEARAYAIRGSHRMPSDKFFDAVGASIMESLSWAERFAWSDEPTDGTSLKPNINTLREAHATMN